LKILHCLLGLEVQHVTTLGNIGTGTWNATAIADGKIASALTGKHIMGYL